MLFLSNVRKFCGFCKGNQWKHVGRQGKLSGLTMKLEALKAEKRKLKAAIRRQLNELAGHVAGLSGGIEPRSLEEIEGTKVTLEV